MRRSPCQLKMSESVIAREILFQCKQHTPKTLILTLSHPAPTEGEPAHDQQHDQQAPDQPTHAEESNDPLVYDQTACTHTHANICLHEQCEHVEDIHNPIAHGQSTCTYAENTHNTMLMRLQYKRNPTTHLPTKIKCITQMIVNYHLQKSLMTSQ